MAHNLQTTRVASLDTLSLLQHMEEADGEKFGRDLLLSCWGSEEA